jgi:hypothetical protein
VVHAYPEGVKTDAAKIKFQQDVQKWVEGRVSKHKFLRGGEFGRFHLHQSTLLTLSSKQVSWSLTLFRRGTSEKPPLIESNADRILQCCWQDPSQTIT